MDEKTNFSKQNMENTRWRPNLEENGKTKRKQNTKKTKIKLIEKNQK